MENIIIGFIPLLFLFFKNRRDNNVFINIFFIFNSVILLGSCLCVYYKVYIWDINPFNIFVFELFYAIGMSFFKGNSFNLQHIANQIVLKKLNRYYFIPYLILFFVFLYIFLPKCFGMNPDDYHAIYEELRHGDTEKFNNSIEKLVNYLIVGFNVPTLIISFAYLAYNEKIRGSILLCSGISTIIINAVYTVSRADLVNLGIIVFLIFSLWKPYLNNKLNKYLVYIFAISSIILISFGVIITISRAAFKTDNLWILDYFGLSPLTYNSVIEYNYSYKGGLYFLGNMESFMSSQPNFAGVEFMPLIARFFVDFSVFGPVILLIITKLIKPKNVLYISDFYLTIYIYITLLFGLMYSKVQIKEVIFTMSIYYLLRFLFKTNKQ